MKTMFMLAMAFALTPWFISPAHAEKMETAVSEDSQAYNPLGKKEIAQARKITREYRKSKVLLDVGLIEDEEKGFWPVYDKYRHAMWANNDKLMSLIAEHMAARKNGTLTDKEALKMTRRFLEIQTEKLGIKKAFIDKFSKVLPGKKLARFYQVDHRLDIVDYLEISDVVPLIK